MSFDGSRARPSSPFPAPAPEASRFHLAFEYVGHAPMLMVGPASGQRYRFTPGTVVAVDPRDRSALAAIPLLRRR
jgi:hypothetical protein